MMTAVLRCLAVAAVLVLVESASASAAIRYVTASKTVDAQFRGSAKARCPAGYEVAGGGISNTAPNTSGKVVSTRPVDGLDADSLANDAWGATVDNGSANTSLDVTAYATCVSGKLKRGLTHRTQNGVAVEQNQASITVSCPIGSKVVGGGVTSTVEFSRTSLNATSPVDGADGNGKSDDAWIGFIDAEFGSGVGTRIAAHAICARGELKQGLRYVSDSQDVALGTQDLVTVDCPAQTRVLGGGVTNPAGYNQASVNASRHEDGFDPDAARDDGWIGIVNNFGGANPLAFTTFAICR